MTALVANLAIGAVVSSAVCTCISLLSLNCSTPSGPHVIPNWFLERKSHPSIIPGVSCLQIINCCW